MFNIYSVVFSFGKDLNGQNHSSSGSHCTIKSLPSTKFPTPWKNLSEFIKKLRFGLAGIQKNQKFPPKFFFLIFEPPLWIY